MLVIGLGMSTPMFGADYIKNLSVETFAAIKHTGITKGEDYGAGVGFEYKFNQYVSGVVRAVSYSNDDWRGSTIDEGSLLVKATLFGSASKGVSLYGIGGVDRAFGVDDWGFGAGVGVGVKLHKNVELFGETRVRAWMDAEKDLITAAGINWSF